MNLDKAFKIPFEQINAKLDEQHQSEKKCFYFTTTLEAVGTQPAKEVKVYMRMTLGNEHILYVNI